MNDPSAQAAGSDVFIAAVNIHQVCSIVTLHANLSANQTHYMHASSAFFSKKAVRIAGKGIHCRGVTSILDVARYVNLILLPAVMNAKTILLVLTVESALFPPT